ncbi:MAG: AAA family ATPase [Victivallaceae bacterium]|nr:AAA family ATPase [Victivallaceae bacterium]
MIIKAIHIANYGKYSGRAFTGLTGGVNVIYGPNEHGKTTLLEFVRRMLFGFPSYRRSEENYFEPVNKAQPGGRLVCVLDSGEEITIERTGWRKGGALTLSLPGGRSSDSQQELNELLRAGEAFYRNVYAITIDELYSVKSLNEEDIRSRIYGAGLDLGGVSLAAIRKQFQTAAEALFKDKGRNQPVHKLDEQRRDYEQRIKAAAAGLSRYEEILTEQEANREKIEALRRTLKEIAARSSELTGQCAGLSEFINSEALTLKLEAIPACPAVTQDDVDAAQELTGELKAAAAELRQAEKKQFELQEKLRAVKVNSALLGLAPELALLERSSERYRADCRAVKEQAARCGELESQLAATRQEIARLWQENRLPDQFSFDLEFTGRIEEFEREFSALRQQQLTAAVLAAQAAPGFRQSGKQLALLGLAAVLEAVLIAAGMAADMPFLIGIAAAALAFTAAAAVKGVIAKPRAAGTAVPPEEKLLRLQECWRELLTQKHFKNTLTPEDLLKCAGICKTYLKDQASRTALERELEEKRRWLTDIEELLAKAAATVDRRTLISDAAADIELLSRQFRENEKAAAEQQHLQAELKIVDKQLASAGTAVKNCAAALEHRLAEFRAADLPDLRRMLGHSRDRRILQEKLAETRDRLKTIFGLGAQMAKIRAQLENFSRDHAEAELAGLEERKNDLQRQLDELNRRQGELNNEKKQLVSADELAMLHNEHERCIEQLRNHALRWAEYKTAELLIDRAVNQYERERQPEVISRAAEIFRELTGGRYASIRKPAETDELLLAEADGAIRRVIELSRGTREQLYLAMRLGLIGQYEAQSESLPLIFDDVLVNFDRRRLEAALETVFGFARDRQLIVLTCHENIRSALLKYGASDISTPAYPDTGRG